MPACGWRRSSRDTRAARSVASTGCSQRHARGAGGTRHHLRARPQRGAGGDRGVGQPSRSTHGHRHSRRGRGSLVRQGARPGPGDRRHPARQHVRRQPARRDAASGRRRPGLQVVHRARRQRAIAGRSGHPGAVPAQRPRDRHDGHARRGAVARLGMRGGAEDRRRRRRRRLVRRRQRSSDIDIVVPEVQWEGRPFVYRQRPMAAPADSLDAEADLYGPRCGGRARLRCRERTRRHRGRSAARDHRHRRHGNDIRLGAAGAARSGCRRLRAAPCGCQAAAHRHAHPAGARHRRDVRRAGSSEIIVVEDKTAFIETQMREILYGRADAPRIIGKKDATGGC